ncbi:MAG: M48 family metallopeptidase [Balneolales bacterium]|nr:M48 family metallopeptidase [Balneolales bacterium]
MDLDLEPETGAYGPVETDSEKDTEADTDLLSGPAARTLTVSGICIDVILKDIKNMHLAVYPPTGRVRIAAPLHVKEDRLRLFVISKLGWIRRHQRNFLKHERETPREFKERESHYFMGRRYLLRLKPTEGAGYADLKAKTYLDLYLNVNAGTSESGGEGGGETQGSAEAKGGARNPAAESGRGFPDGISTAYKRRILHEWYRSELKKRIPALLEKWEQKLGVKVSHWQVRQMKTKWGSCNTETARITLNLELAKKPERCLEYIIVHEMMHLLERHHNTRFRQLMDTHYPNWREVRAELNR